MLVTQHRERWPMDRLAPLHGRTRRRGAPPDPRLDNPYFKGKNGRSEVTPDGDIRANAAIGGSTNNRHE